MFQLSEVRHQDYIGIIRERDIKISELSHTLEQLRTELLKYRSSDDAESEGEGEEEEEGRKGPHEVEGTPSVGMQALTEDSPAVLSVSTHPDPLAMDSLVRGVCVVCVCTCARSCVCGHMHVCVHVHVCVWG